MIRKSSILPTILSYAIPMNFTVLSAGFVVYKASVKIEDRNWLADLPLDV